MAGMGNAMMGTGEAEGDGRAIKAAEDALCNPLLGELSVKVGALDFFFLSRALFWRVLADRSVGRKVSVTLFDV